MLEAWNDLSNTTWEVVELRTIGVQNMTHTEIVESILSDLVALHFGGVPQGVPWYDFFRHVHSSTQEERVLDALVDDRVQNLVANEGQNMRLIDTREALQEAQDIAGCWTEGYDPPPGTNVLTLSDSGRDLIEQCGVEGAVAFVLAEMTTPGSQAMH